MKALWTFPLVGLALCSGATAEEAKKPVPLYTNEDLDRLSPYRGQTGVLSLTEPAADRVRAGSETSGPAKESYWRKEAARVRERVDALRQRADDLRSEIDEARESARSSEWSWSSRSPRTSKARSVAPKEARLKAVEDQMRHLELDLAERARRAGALPGWLR